MAGRDVDHYVGKNQYVVLDLRDYDDYAAGHIQGAVNLPYIFFDDYLKKLPVGKKYILYCNYGSVSMLAGKRMDEVGYDVLSISGGILSYRGRLFV